jgi:hypothetical protein
LSRKKPASGSSGEKYSWTYLKIPSIMFTYSTNKLHKLQMLFSSHKTKKVPLPAKSFRFGKEKCPSPGFPVWGRVAFDTT